MEIQSFDYVYQNVMKKSNQIVTIIVLTYNSEDTIIETLNSIKLKTYNNIELIISDDGSKDDTISICEQWLELNGQIFSFYRLATVAENTGISANCKRALKSYLGEWVKFFAGDDILLPSFVEEMVNFCITENFSVAISDMLILKGDTQTRFNALQKDRDKFFSLSQVGKYHFYLNFPFFLNTPSSFFKRSLFDSIQPFFENYKLLEDQPLFYSILASGTDIGYLRKEVVIYRMHQKSITGDVNVQFSEDLYKCFCEFRKPYMKKDFKAAVLKMILSKYYYFMTNRFTGKTLKGKIILVSYNKIIKMVASANNAHLK